MANNVTSEDLRKSLSIIRDNAMDAIRGFLNEKLGNGKSINLDYYCVEDSVVRYHFLDIDSDGYGRGLVIDGIELDKNGEPTFAMVDEDGDGWGERELADFNAVELVWILEMLEDAFETINDLYDGVVLPKDCFDYDEIEED